MFASDCTFDASINPIAYEDGDAVFIDTEYDTWNIHKGTNCNVFGNIIVVNPKNIRVGDDCSFNHGAYINAFNPISVGNDVTISAGAKILSTGIDYKSWAAGKKQHSRSCGISIGDHVWIGADAKVLDGVKISGKYVVIAAGAVVTKDIDEDYVIIGGCPARVIKQFDKDSNEDV